MLPFSFMTFALYEVILFGLPPQSLSYPSTDTAISPVTHYYKHNYLLRVLAAPITNHNGFWERDQDGRYEDLTVGREGLKCFPRETAL